MDKTLQKYYDDRFAMMATQGWTDLMDDVKEMQKAIDNLLSVQDEKALFFRKGQLDIILWLSTLRETSAKAYDQLTSSGEASDES